MKKRILCKGCPAFHEPCLESGSGANPAHLIVVGATPSGFSIGEGEAFFGSDGRLFKKLLERVRKRKKYEDIKIYYTYSALVSGYKATASHIEHCQTNIIREIGNIRGINGQEPILVPLGPLALKAVGVQAKKITDVVGRVMTTTISSGLPTGPRKLQVVPLLSMDHVNTRPGTVNVVQSALLKAVKLAFADDEKLSPLEEITDDYIFPQTAEEVEELVDHIVEYHDESATGGPDNHVIAIDTETNTLEPYLHGNPLTLMLSVAWDKGKAATILLDHLDAPYKGAALERVWNAVRRLLRCPKPKVLHNWKFDQKFLEVVNGIPVNRVAWDTLLGEHYLDEDKKGLYSLKQLTPLYAPNYQGYDDELQEIFRGEKESGVIRLKNSDIISILAGVKIQIPPDVAIDNPINWTDLGFALCKREDIKKVSAKKRTPEQQESFRKLGAEIQKLRNKIGIKQPSKKYPRSWGGAKPEGYSAVPIETIVRYAGVDADVTRIVFMAQVQRLRKTNTWEEGLSVMKYLYLPGSRVLSAMEYRGFNIDQILLGELTDAVTERMNVAQEEIASKFDSSLNLNAAKQVADMMAKLKFEPLPGIEQGGTGKDVLDKYIGHYDEDDPRHLFAEKVLEYRECNKTLSSFLEPIRGFSEADGKVHCTFHLNGTSTGRLCVDKDTPLDTSHGTFSISKLDLHNNQNVTIMTHKGRMRRILRKYFKGFERMIRVRLDDGSEIICTRAHMPLTPHDWRHAGELSIGSKICGADSIRKADPRTTTGFDRSGIHPHLFDRRTHGKGNSGKVQHQSPRMAYNHSCIPGEVRGAITCCAAQELRTIKVRKQLRTSPTYYDDTERAISKFAQKRDPAGSHSSKIRDIGVVRSSQYATTQSSTDKPASTKYARDGFLLPGKVRSTRPGHYRQCSSGIILRRPAHVFQRTVRGVRGITRTTVVHPRAEEGACLFLSEKTNTTRSHLLVGKSSRDAAIVSSFGGEHPSHSRIHLLQDFPRGLLVPGHKATRRSRRRTPSEVLRYNGTRQTAPTLCEETWLPHVALQAGACSSRCTVGGYTYPERTVVSIEDAGVREVWDIEVEEDHSYLAQGFVNHNSSARPNMQNIPKITGRKVKENPDGTKTIIHPGFNIKQLFIPSKPGNVIVNVDIKGAELRVYTAYSHDKSMIHALNEGLDVHSFVTSLVYKIPYETVMELKEKGDPEVDKKRLKCKRTVFCTFYGGGPYKVAEQIGSTIEEAKEIQTRLFTEFPALPNYIETVTDKVRRKQQVQTLFGRIRRFRLAHATNRHFQDAKREAVNFLIQSTASDLVLSQLCEVNDHLHELGGEMLITVHDSMVFELPEENVQKLFAFMDHWIVDRVKEKYDWLPVPFEYDVEAGPSYGKVKEVHRNVG